MWRICIWIVAQYIVISLQQIFSGFTWSLVVSLGFILSSSESKLLPSRKLSYYNPLFILLLWHTEWNVVCEVIIHVHDVLVYEMYDVFIYILYKIDSAASLLSYLLLNANHLWPLLHVNALCMRSPCIAKKPVFLTSKPIVYYC